MCLVSALGQKTTLAEYVFIPGHDISKWFSYTSNQTISGKKLPGIPKLPEVSTYMVVRLRTEKLAQCLLPNLLIQEKPIAKFATMHS